MKRSLASTLVLLLLYVLASAQTASWKDYEYADSGIAFSSPAQPVAENKDENAASGKVRSHNYTIDLGNDSGVMISYADFGASPTKASAKDVLAAARDGAARSVNGKVVGETEISLDGNPGIAFELEAEKYHARCRFYEVRGLNLLTAMAIFPAGHAFSADADKVLGSLRLLKPPKK